MSETAPKVTDVAKPATTSTTEKEVKKLAEKQVERKRRGSSSSHSQKSKREPPRPEFILVGKRPNTDYVYLLKKLMKEEKFETMHLSGKGENGNTKVIWIANRMVTWGYCQITKI